jgi:hypothetical protein
MDWNWKILAPIAILLAGCSTVQQIDNEVQVGCSSSEGCTAYIGGKKPVNSGNIIKRVASAPFSDLQQLANSNCKFLGYDRGAVEDRATGASVILGESYEFKCKNDEKPNLVAATRYEEALKLKEAAEIRHAQDAAKRRQADAVKGYKHIQFNDFELDAGRALRYGSKIGITGDYKMQGQLELLAANAISYQLNSTYKIVLLTKDAPRDTRRTLIEMKSGTCGMGGYCKVTVLGRVSQCEITWLGHKVRETSCLLVDEIRNAD